MIRSGPATRSESIPFGETLTRPLGAAVATKKKKDRLSLDEVGEFVGQCVDHESPSGCGSCARLSPILANRLRTVDDAFAFIATAA